jgi:hypothetical protein
MAKVGAMAITFALASGAAVLALMIWVGVRFERRERRRERPSRGKEKSSAEKYQP